MVSEIVKADRMMSEDTMVFYERERESTVSQVTWPEECGVLRTNSCIGGSFEGCIFHGSFVGRRRFGSIDHRK